MAWFSTMVRCRSQIKLASAVLRTIDSSFQSIRTISAFPSKCTFKLQNSFNRCALSSKVRFLPLNGKQSQSLLQRDGMLFQGKRIACVVRFFHTSGASSARMQSGHDNNLSTRNKNALIYVVAVFILMLGGAYAGVPLYKVFCQATGLGGQAVRGHDTDKIETMEKVDRQIRVRFNADVASSMRWNFRPQQTEVTVAPGETALAFYTAKNPTDKPIIGISTYNVLPYDAGQYFNKIQCFCFEEQRLNPKEQVDMPVFFFIDPDFATDPKLEHIDTITLSYTFFEAVEGLTLPLPGYPQPHDPLPVS